MSSRKHHALSRLVPSSLTLALLGACGAGDFSIVDEEQAFDLLQAQRALSASCGEDDSNELAAGLAVAIASELGRWDVNTDFIVRDGKLELSPTGELHCGSECPKITALLRLQDDASSAVPNHVPATYRSKLTSWYSQQKTVLTDLVSQMLNVDQGVFRIRSQLSGKYIVPQGGSTTSGAVLQQSNQFDSDTASQWRIRLQGTRQQLINVKSGMCMDLLTDISSMTNIVQRPCSGASTQDFRLGELNIGLLTLRTKHDLAFMPQGASHANGATIVQNTVFGAVAEQFVFEPYGSGVHRDLLETVTAVYSLDVEHTGMGIAVSSSSMNDGVTVVQQPYDASDDRFHWYITQLGSAVVNGATQTTYQFMNRRNGKCLDLDGSSPNKLEQRTCSIAATQRFMLTPTGNLRQVIFSSNALAMGVENASTRSGAQLVEGRQTWESHNMMAFRPILAIEPHRLSYSHTTEDGPCGNYDWYRIEQPNGLPLEDPASTFVQLIFAGGKQTSTGADNNPYIAQQVSGDLVAIDPTYGLSASDTTTTGACAAACVSISSSNIAGKCCSCEGDSGRFTESPWSETTFVCDGGGRRQSRLRAVRRPSRPQDVWVQEAFRFRD
jgi:hypothetical protein